MENKKIIYLTTYLDESLSKRLALPFFPAGLKKKKQLIELLNISGYISEIIFVSSFSRFSKLYSKPFNFKQNKNNFHFPLFFYFPILNYLFNPIFVLFKLLKLNKEKKIDFLILYNSVYENVLAVLIFKKILRINTKVIIQFEDGWISNSTGFRKLIYYFSHRIGEFVADAAIVNSNNMTNVFSSNKYFLFRGITELREFNALKKNVSEFNVLFTSNIDSTRGIDLLINLFYKYKGVEKLDHFNFQITGFGDNEKVKQLLLSIKYFNSIGGNATYYGYVSNNELAILYEKSHVLLALQNPNLNFSKYCFPSKIMEYYNYNKPIITTNISDLKSDEFINLKFIEYNHDSLLSCLNDHYFNYKRYYNLNKSNNKEMYKNFSKIEYSKKLKKFINSL